MGAHNDGDVAAALSTHAQQGACVLVRVHGLLTDTDEPALPSLLARGARTSEPGAAADKGLPAGTAPAAAPATNGGGASAPGSVTSGAAAAAKGPSDIAPLSGSTTGAKRPGKWRSLFEGTP